MIFVALVLAGCSGANVQIAGDIPTPFVNRLPLRVGLYLEPALVQYVFEEKIQDHGDWRVEVGPMQPKLFRQVAIGDVRRIDTGRLVDAGTRRISTRCSRRRIVGVSDFDSEHRRAASFTRSGSST